jgi:hypothetical protein
MDFILINLRNRTHHKELCEIDLNNIYCPINNKNDSGNNQKYAQRY